MVDKNKSKVYNKIQNKEERPLDIKEIFMYNLTGNRQQATGNRQQATGNRQQATALTIDSNLSKRINSLRFLLIVFVIIIHNGINEKSFTGRNITVIIPGYVERIQSIIGIVTAIAVPLFFLISSYLLYIKEQKFAPVLKKKCKSILLPYFLWSVLMVLLYLTMQTLPFIKGFFRTDPEHLIKNYNIIDWIDVFWGKITYRNEYGHPFVAQFWFLRDLFILNLLFIPIKKLIDRFPLGILVLCMILWTNNVNIYVVSSEALMFFVLGCYIVKYGLTEKNIDAITIIDLLVIYGITIISEFILAGKMPLLHKINIVIGCMFFLKISQNIIGNKKLYETLVWLGKYEFFVYAVHMAIMPQFLKIYIRTIPLNGVYILLGYFAVIIVGIIVSLISGIIFKKILPKTYGILTGGRV
jgi:fucose 4-O-acetylase-like acetyltransferase